MPSDITSLAMSYRAAMLANMRLTEELMEYNEELMGLNSLPWTSDRYTRFRR